MKKIKVWFPIIIFLSLLGLVIPVRYLYSQTPDKESAGREVSAGQESKPASIDLLELLNKHLGDSYFWPLLGMDKRSSSLPLPVILGKSGTGWDFFWSSRLWDGAHYKGYYIAQEGKYAGKIVMLNSLGEEVRPLDLSMTRNACALFLSGLLLVSFLLFVARLYRRRPLEMPKRALGGVEMIMITLIDDVIKPCIGRDYKRYVSYLLTLFFFILTINLMGLIVVFPGGVNLSGNVSVTMVLAGCTLVITILSGTRAYWKEIFWPDVPVWLNAPVPMMTIIEVFEIFSKPFALMIRMFANMFGGHVIGMVLVVLIFIIAPMGASYAWGTALFVVPFSVFMLLIEVLICVIQAYVFFMLSTLFIGLARVRY